MKTRIISFIILSSIFVLLFASCRKDDKPAQLFTDSQEIIFKKNETVQYFGITNMGNATMDFQVSTNDDFLSVSPSSGTIGFNQLAKIQVNAETSGLDYGLHTGSINIQSNGGSSFVEVTILNPYPDPPALWWDIDYIKIAANSNRDYITISNDGEGILEYNLNTSSSWMSFSQNSGNLSPGQEDKVWVIADRTGLSNDLYSGVVNITSNGGNANVDVDMEVGVYSVSFFNPTYTVVDIKVPGFEWLQIPVLDRVNYIFPSNPGAIIYQAETKGETVNFQQLGLTLTWQETINLNNEDSPVFYLNISEDFFFLSAQNYGAHDLNNWSINYDTEYQFDEDVNIPNDGYEYYFGYYDALNNSNVYASIVGTNTDAYWEQGKEFNFPWTLNQGILVESDLKKSGIISNRIFKKKSDTPETLNIKPQTQKNIRVRNAQSLENTNRR